MYTNSDILRTVTDGKSVTTTKKYKAMIDKITTLSGEKTIQLAIKKPTATHRILRDHYDNDRSLRSYLSLISVMCNSITDVASTLVKSKWKCYCEDVNK